MSNELESDRAVVRNLESFGVDGAGYDETETEGFHERLDVREGLGRMAAGGRQTCHGTVQ
jgi:hypothetical protein